MKIIETDNRCSDYPYEVHVLGGLSLAAAEEIAALINKHLVAGDHARRYWIVVDDDHVLDVDGPA